MKKHIVSALVAATLANCVYSTALATPGKAIQTPASAPISASSVSIDELQAKVDKSRDVNQDIVAQALELVKKDPNNAKAHYLLACVYQRAGFDDLSEQEFLKSNEITPLKKDILLDLFTARLEKNDLGAAGKFFGYLQKRFPSDGVVMFMRGSIIAQKDPELADKVFNEAIDLAPTDSPVRTSVAAYRLHWNRPQEAYDLAMVDLKKFPNRLVTQIIVGKSLVGLGRPNEAIPYLKLAYEAAPTDTNLADVYYRTLMQVGKIHEAVEPSLISLAMQTDHMKMEKCKASVNTLLGLVPRSEVTAAIQSADSKLAKSSYQSRLHLAMGDVFDRAGLNTLAIAEYKKGLQYDPTVARGYYRLAMDMNQAGNYSEAMKYFIEAYNYSPTDRQVLQGMSRLKDRLNNRDNDIALRTKDWFRHPN